ncbi:trihelix transcription factor ENAP2 isoform X3 [Populus trichocarpa]|uniref:Myb/SANT-like DNA-binding domain-containing protein n=1 Tax=Populus trichocarpa TaxID=3694 RepID=A0A3N7H4P1_POPTR|nr:trihelix transcription factor ENAP2 isoform X3 [Populus trichocarpa]|eukprot:XP_024465070.1 trihelix transcription factor ASIL2 isoform X3 [Populus trichocarpa]
MAPPWLSRRLLERWRPYTLIEAWGDRYINPNRGNVGQKDWKEVADTVNNRQNGVKPKKTDVQCKNRIVMLKKKYKIEKSKPPPLSWPLCNRLDSLIGTNSNTTNTDKKPTSFTVKSKKKPKKRMFSGLASYSESSSDDDEDDMAWFEERLKKKRHRMEDVGLSDGAACRELARAILKFGEIPERIESSRQRQMIELEKQRMEFTKEVEFERLNMFVDAQLDHTKKSFKRDKFTSSSGNCSEVTWLYLTVGL